MTPLDVRRGESQMTPRDGFEIARTPEMLEVAADIGFLPFAWSFGGTDDASMTGR
jgi:hypothetical protein